MAQNENIKRKEWIIIGIGGVTCGGKTTLTNQLKDKLTPITIINQEKYLYPRESPNHVKCNGLDHNNYDILSAFHMEAMYNAIMDILQGDVRHIHESSTDGNDKFVVRGKKFLVMEGSTLLNYKPILELCDLRFYFVLDYGECMSRRVYRLYDPPDVHGYFELCVWPAHLKYRQEIPLSDLDEINMGPHGKQQLSNKKEFSKSVHPFQSYEIEKDRRVRILDGRLTNAFEIVMDDISSSVLF